MAWGLVPLVAVLTLGLGALIAPRATGFERLLTGAVSTLTVTVTATWLLAALGVLSALALLAVLCCGAVTVGIAVRLRRAPWQLPWRMAISWPTAPVLAVAAAAVALVVLSAYYVPVWQWDALGYHLPFVNLVLQRGTLADVPVDVPYLSTYPHIVEWAFTAWRVLLPDDRLVELAHVPFGLVGACAIATIAHRFGARPDHALAVGAAWLTLPAVFLQLPTNYTDAASAALALAAIAFVLSADLTSTRVVMAGVAIGLFLGSKPQAPLGAAVLLVVLTALGWRAGRRPAVAVAWLMSLGLGSPSYVANIVRHGNPVWPVTVDFGPLHLPGTRSMASLLQAGANAPRTHGNVVARVVESWTTVVSPVPVFDMRIGGLGLLFLIALPVAVVSAVRIRSVAVALCAVATLSTPDPAVARYVLAFAGVTLALAAPALRHLGRHMQTVVLGALAAIAAWNLVLSYPGLTGEGPPLTAYPAMTPAQRQRAVGADGVPTPYLDAVARVRAGEVTVIDAAAELPYLAWPSDLRTGVRYLPVDADAATAERIITAPEVRLLIVGDDTAGGVAARLHPELFTELFRCRSAACGVYLRR